MARESYLVGMSDFKPFGKGAPTENVIPCSGGYVQDGIRRVCVLAEGHEFYHKTVAAPWPQVHGGTPVTENPKCAWCRELLAYPDTPHAHCATERRKARVEIASRCMAAIMTSDADPWGCKAQSGVGTAEIAVEWADALLAELEK